MDSGSLDFVPGGVQSLKGKSGVTCCLVKRVDSDKARALEGSHLVPPDISKFIF